ncbi:MAG: hypothetical protein V9G04_09945 [Nocardioides sp.]
MIIEAGRVPMLKAVDVADDRFSLLIHAVDEFCTERVDLGVQLVEPRVDLIELRVNLAELGINLLEPSAACRKFLDSWDLKS